MYVCLLLDYKVYIFSAGTIGKHILIIVITHAFLNKLGYE